MNIDALLAKATKGSLSDSELSFAADLAASRSSDAYTAIMVLGRSFAKKYRPLVETYLESPDNPMFARGAVYALCDCWDETERYLPQIIAFCRKVDWDDENDVRLIALSSAGEFLRNNWSQELAECVLHVAETEEDVIISNAAKQAIARAVGLEYSEIPSPRQILAETGKIGEDTLARFRKRMNASST